VEYFLADQKRIEQIGEKSDQIKKELKKLVESFNDELIITKIKKVLISENFDEDGFTNAILSKDNLSNKEVEELRKDFIKKTYRTSKVLSNAPYTLTVNKPVFSLEVKWKDVVEHYGGYSELAKQGISKDDLWKFSIKAVAESINLLSIKENFINIKIEGSENALKFHNVDKTNFKYEGSLKIPKYSVNNIYNRASPNVIFSFEGRKYMRSQNIEIPIEKIISPSIDLNYLFTNYNLAIEQLIDDFITNEEFLNLNEVNPKVSEIKKIFTQKLTLLEKARKFQKEENEWLKNSVYEKEDFINTSMELLEIENRIESMIKYAREEKLKNQRGWCIYACLIYFIVAYIAG